VTGVVKDEYYYCWNNNNISYIFKALETSNDIGRGFHATSAADVYFVREDKYSANHRLVYFDLEVGPQYFKNYRKATKKEIELFESKNRIEFKKGEVYEAYNKEENLKYFFVAFEANNNAIASYCNVSDHRVARGGLFPFNFYTFKKATLEDLQTALYKYGKEWNVETKKLDITRVKYGNPYFYICDSGGIILQDTDDFLGVDDNRFKSKNYFHTEEAAEKYNKELVIFIDKFHEAN